MVKKSQNTKSQKPKSQKPQSKKPQSKKPKSYVKTGGSLASDKVMKVANGVGMTLDDYSKMPLPKMGSLKKQTGGSNCGTRSRRRTSNLVKKGNTTNLVKKGNTTNLVKKGNTTASKRKGQTGGSNCAARKQTGGSNCAARKQTGGSNCGTRSKKRSNLSPSKKGNYRTKKSKRKGQKGGNFLNLAGCGPVNAPDAGRKYAKHFSKTSSCPGPEFYANPPGLDKAGSGTGNEYPFN